jgi:hypothetical protein
MNLRAKARRPLGVLAFAAAIGFFFASASPAGAQDSTDNGNHEHESNYSASVHGSCELYAVTIKNDSHHDVFASITFNGVKSIVKVNDESHVTIPLDVLEDVPNTIVVKIGDEILLNKSFTVNCEADPEAHLTATITGDCGNFVITIKNEGDADGSATVTVNGVDSNVAVAAGQTVTMSPALVEDADNTIAVKAGETELAHKALHVNCKEDERPTTTTLPPAPTTTMAEPVQVLSETVAQPQTLAFTGRNTVFEAMVGVVLLGIGFQLMRSSRRLEQS